MSSRGFVLGMFAILVACASKETPASTTSSGSSSSGNPHDAGTDRSVVEDAAPRDPLQPSTLPAAQGECPEMTNLNGSFVTFAGQKAKVWSGDPSKGKGPLVLYYYATGSSTAEPQVTLQQAQIDFITSKGGAVVAQYKTTGAGSTTGNNVWYTGDAAIADEIVACSLAKQKIDPRQIHVAGYSAGAIQAVYMGYARSGYIATVLSYSGGDVALNHAPLQDPKHMPAAFAAHGKKGVDMFEGVVDFADASEVWVKAVKDANGFAISCDDGGDHGNYQLRAQVAPQAVQFMLDHPFNVSPFPYTKLPSGYPEYCSIR